MKPAELRGMSDEQLDLTLKETVKNLFHLRFQSATDRLETPSEIRRPSTTWPASRPSSANVELASETGSRGAEARDQLTARV